MGIRRVAAPARMPGRAKIKSIATSIISIYSTSLAAPFVPPPAPLKAGVAESQRYAEALGK